MNNLYYCWLCKFSNLWNLGPETLNGLKDNVQIYHNYRVDMLHITDECQNTYASSRHGNVMGLMPMALTVS